VNHHRLACVAVLAASILTLAFSACGGSDTGASSGEPTSTEYVPSSSEYELQKRGDLGVKTALVTLVSQPDGKTSIIFNFYVPITPETRDDVYPVAIQGGTCDRPGEVERDLGDLGSGISTVVVDSSFDEVNDPITTGASSIVIMASDRRTVAWCGPTSTAEGY
jgi:hypothetical protein